MDGEKTLPVAALPSLPAEHFILPDADGNELAATISRSLGMFQICYRQQGRTISDWMIETIQEIVRKMSEAERRLFPIPNVRIDDREY